jgi:hypothetical protein
VEGTPQVKRNARGPRVVLDAKRESLVTHSGALLIEETIKIAGLAEGLSVALAPWRKKRARHDPGKAILDLAVAVALGGDCASDLAAVRAQSDLFGAVASDPTISRLFTALSNETLDADAAVAAIRGVRADARKRVWARRRPLAGTAGRRDGGQVIIDIDATLVDSHSDKQHAEPTHKRTFGHAPMCSFLDHGATGTGEPLVLNLRPGSASPWKSADHITILDDSLVQLPEAERGQVLVRTDAGGCSKAFLHHITDLGLEYSIGFPARDGVVTAVEAIPEDAWIDALDGDGQPRDGAQVADLTAWIPTPTKPTRSEARFGPQTWPEDMRVLARREIPHPGAQLRVTDHNGWRITCFATNTPTTSTATGAPTRWAVPDLEVRHRQRARAEDRIRCLKDTGMRNLPYYLFDQNRIWLEIVALAADLLTWTQTLAFDTTSEARRWEPKTLRFRILAVAGRIIHTSRQRRLRLADGWPWNDLIDTGYASLTTA